jgi:8-amino-7-oxononanoate synthase
MDGVEIVVTAGANQLAPPVDERSIGRHMSTRSIETPSGGPAPQNPFGAFFETISKAEVRENPLLRGTNARRWFETLSWGVREDLYTYQQSFDRASGARVRLGTESLLMLSSYDYLGLMGHPEIECAAIEAIREVGTSTGGVRLLSGTGGVHLQLEEALAAFKGTESAITFSSGYAANTALLTTLFGRRDLVVVDARAHRSVIEGCRACGVPLRKFDHNDPTSLEKALQHGPQGRILIVVDGLYSMDGDVCPLPEIIDLKQRYGAMLMVDEAHSLGVLGARGRGVHEHFGVDPSDVDIWTGSLSKAIPANGGFVASSRALIILLQHEAAPFVFSAALAPASAAAARASLHVIAREPERIKRAWRNAAALRSDLAELGYEIMGETPLIPIAVGSEEDAWRLSRRLFARGVVANAVTYPAVARGAAILRLCATAAQSTQDLQVAREAFESACGCLTSA